MSSVLEAPLCKRWERPDCSSHTRCALTHTPNASQLDRVVCKTQHQPNEKHIVSQKKLGGQKRAAQRPGTLDRASEPTWREEGQFCPSAHPSSPPRPCKRGPQAFAFLLLQQTSYLPKRKQRTVSNRLPFISFPLPSFPKPILTWSNSLSSLREERRGLTSFTESKKKKRKGRR